jgi:uncharacterized RmlC-like cupin family protein
VASAAVEAARAAVLDAAFRTGDYAGAETGLRALLRDAERAGDRWAEAVALDRLGMLMHFQALDRALEGAQPDAEQALFERALAIRREIGDTSGTAESLFDVGLVHQVLRQDWDRAMPLYRKAEELAGADGDPLLRSEVHRHIGFYHAAHEDRPDLALPRLRLSQELRETLDEPGWLVSGLTVLGRCELALGMHADALDHLRRAVRLARDLGLRERYVRSAEDMLRQAELARPPAAGCRVVRSGDAYEGRQGLTYLRGLTGETVGSTGICLTVLVLPDGARARTHLHRGIETAVYVIEGRCEMFHGSRLAEHVEVGAGDYVYIPADAAHLVMNRSGAPATAVVAHTAASDQEGIVLLPELDALIP